MSEFIVTTRVTKTNPETSDEAFAASLSSRSASSFSDLPGAEVVSVTAVKEGSPEVTFTEEG
jgi:hypothetical protein